MTIMILITIAKLFSDSLAERLCISNHAIVSFNLLLCFVQALIMAKSGDHSKPIKLLLSPSSRESNHGIATTVNGGRGNEEAKQRVGDEGGVVRENLFKERAKPSQASSSLLYRNFGK
ncbi:hypothetical protein VNO77_30266 [Canavalia gladiata]|uniref:Uncharacterized protein n=1 Tax=Canavalia gladiata TaxID=3824 RepID=A0AAN9KN94_CANGL